MYVDYDRLINLHKYIHVKETSFNSSWSPATKNMKLGELMFGESLCLFQIVLPSH